MNLDPYAQKRQVHLMQDFMAEAEAAARAAGEILLDWQGRIVVKEKGHADLVTQADLAAEKAIFDRLQTAFPDHGFLGEEQGTAAEGSGEYTWIVDPLDGTTNYVHGVPIFGVSIALAKKSEIVLGIVFNPVTGEFYSAERGGGAFLNGAPIRTSVVEDLSQALVAASLPPRVEPGSLQLRELLAAVESTQAVRRFGSAALNLCFVAAGRLDAYWASSVQSWDIAAGMLLVHEAGGYISHISGNPFDWQNPQIAAAAGERLSQQLIEMLGKAHAKT